MSKNLKIQQKLIVLCSAFLIPIGFLAYLFITQTEKDVTFAAKELEGSAYFNALRLEMTAIIALSQGTATAADVGRAQEAVLRFDADKAADMSATDSAGKAAEAVRADLKLPAGSAADAHDPALDAVSDHIAKVEDGSNLTLDPDLDSFYSQDFVTVKMPAVVIAASRALTAARPMMGGEAPTPETTVAFLTHKGEFVTALSGLDGDIASGERGNPDGSLKPAIDAAYADFVAKSAAYTGLLDAITATGATRPAIDAVLAAHNAVQRAANALWEVATPEMNHLLAARIGGLRTKEGLSLALTLVVLLGTAAFAWWIARSISRPLLELHRTMHVLATGDTDLTVPHTGRGDEIGVMANDVEVFRNALIRSAELTQVQKREHTATEMASRAQGHLVEEFNAKIVEVIGTVIASAGQLESNAHTMATVSEQSGHQTSAVAAACEQAAANVQTVAAASEELAASSREIAAQVSRASTVAQHAATEAATTDRLVRGLAEAASKIGDVVKLINDIAAQTNLLALNATIEAARAGDAGKGFAVVANEVKNLANQTARATDEIGAQIAEVQQQTALAVDAISGISTTIQQMDELSEAIAAAVEEQGAATQEITRNIQEAHTGTSEVARNAVGLSEGAHESRDAAQSVFSAARDLSREAEAMRAVADEFLIRLESGGGGLSWGTPWLTGHAVIDADHKMLLQYINELNHAMHAGEGRAVAGGVLDKLIQYTRDHFAREEAIWQQGGLASLSQHQQAHAALITKVAAFQRDFAAGQATLTADLMSFLRDWLINHVFKTDKAGVLEIGQRAA